MIATANQTILINPETARNAILIKPISINSQNIIFDEITVSVDRYCCRLTSWTVCMYDLVNHTPDKAAPLAGLSLFAQFQPNRQPEPGVAT